MQVLAGEKLEFFNIRGGVSDNQQVTNLSKKPGVKIFQLLSIIYFFFQHRETINSDEKQRTGRAN